MSFFHADRVAETSTSTGNSTLTLAGAKTGFRTFSSATGGVSCYVYCSVVSQTASEWQVARYSFNGTTTLTFDSLISSSTGSTVTFTAGTKDVFLIHPSILFVHGSALPGGRLTTESGVPVSNTNRTAQSTLYYTAYTGNIIHLWEGGNGATLGGWRPFYFTEISGSISALSSGNCYDVFVYNSGTPASPVLSLFFNAWTNSTTRVAGSLTRVGSAYLYTSDFTDRYVGTIYVSGSGTTEDSLASRFVWNYYNAVPRPMTKLESTNSWTMSYAGIGVARSANNNPANALSVVNPFSQICRIFITGRTMGFNSSTTSNAAGGIGINQNTNSNATAADTDFSFFGQPCISASTPAVVTYSLVHTPNNLGPNTYYWLELVHNSGNTCTFYGADQYGLHGIWSC